MSALRASFLVANHIAKDKKLFTIGEELILPAAKDICCELLGEAAVQKVVCVPLSASTVIRRTDETAEDFFFYHVTSPFMVLNFILFIYLFSHRHTVFYFYKR